MLEGGGWTQRKVEEVKKEEEKESMKEKEREKRSKQKKQRERKKEKGKKKSGERDYKSKVASASNRRRGLCVTVRLKILVSATTAPAGNCRANRRGIIAHTETAIKAGVITAAVCPWR